MHVSRPPRRPWHQVPIIGLLVLCFTHSSMAQISSARVEGLRDNTPRLHALTGARLVLAPGQVIENGTLVLKDGVVIAAGANVAVPAGARVWALEGRTIYPGFIDLASSLGVPANLKPVPPVPASQRGKAPSESKPLNARALANDNASVHPEQDVAQLLELKADDVKAVRELGFTTVLAAPSVGVFQGQSALLNLSDAASPRALVMHARVAQHMANAYGRGARAAYPSSLMGAIALARQTLLDARWYRAAAPANQERVEKDASLEALADVINGRQPVFYATQDELDYQRVARIRDEFSLRTILVGNGFEYRKAAYLKNANLPVVVPLTYPAPPEVENPDTALDTSLESLQHWEQAASNLALLNRAGVEFAVTAAGLKGKTSISRGGARRRQA